MLCGNLRYFGSTVDGKGVKVQKAERGSHFFLNTFTFESNNNCQQKLYRFINMLAPFAKCFNILLGLLTALPRGRSTEGDDEWVDYTDMLRYDFVSQSMKRGVRKWNSIGLTMALTLSFIIG